MPEVFADMPTLRNPVFAQHAICRIHVTDNDGNVLERQIVTSRIGLNGRAVHGSKLQQLDALIAKFQVHHAQMNIRQVVELFIVGAGTLEVCGLLERQHPGIEIYGAVHIAHGHDHRTDILRRVDASWGLREERDRGRPQRKPQHQQSAD